MKAIVVALACAACGDNLAPSERCVATFAGNFADSTSTATCAQLTPADTDQLLELAFDSSTLGAQVEISIDLGPVPVTGTYSSETLATWHAVEAKSIADGACVYSAGDGIVPRGNFTLTLTALDDAAVHGTVEILQYVHAVDGTNCGPGDTEAIDVTF